MTTFAEMFCFADKLKSNSMIKSLWSLRKAKKEAKKLHKRYFERFYVVELSDHSFCCVWKGDLKAQKRMGLVPILSTVRGLEAGAIWHTSYGNGSGAMTKKEEKKRLREYLIGRFPRFGKFILFIVHFVL